ncbi:transmembrane protein 17 isoform X1 [Anabrus simplex]|uniref:transmembrane protein 17 isoform X1 n=1 Tax=Anabrus simplex TaxID=316456 RepID=UPI0034DCEFB2
MSEMLKRSVTNMSETLFPGITHQEVRTNTWFIKPGYEMVSSLPLQMALYFNVILFPFWLAVIIFMAYVKFECLTYVSRFLLVTVLIAVILNECLRLYLGYLGNLLEKVPELVAFWMLSLLLQLPCQLFILFNRAAPLLPGEKTVHIVMILLLLSQLASGYTALRSLCGQQAKRYQMMQIRLAQQRKASGAAKEQSQNN